MKALFSIKNDIEIPTMEELIYDNDGVLTGGFTLVDQFDDYSIYWFETSKTMIDSMKNNKDYKWIKDIEDV